MKCRRALSRYIKNGEELLDQADGARKQIDAVPSDQYNATRVRLAIDRAIGELYELGWID